MAHRLVDGEQRVWDSLAICEYLAEKAPTLWPTDARQRAEARAISAEMHAGFGALRRSMPMEIHASKPHVVRPAEVLADIARIIEDNALTPGGCRVELGSSEVDATLETRWRRVIESIGINQEWLSDKP